jgi:translocation and assembly module TamB
MPSSKNATPQQHRWRRAFRTGGKVLAWLILLPVALVLLVAVLLYLPPVQDLARNKLVGFLQERTGTHIALEELRLRFPLGLTLKGLHIDDLNGDTLVHAGAVKATLSPASLLRQRVVVSGLALEGGRVNIHQASDSTFNFDFLAAAFATPDTVAETLPADTAASDAWTIIIEELALEDLRVRLLLDPSDLAMDLAIGSLAIGFDDFSLDPQQIHLRTVELRRTRLYLRMAPSNEPPEPDTYPLLENPMQGHDIRFERFLVEDLDFSLKDPSSNDSLWLVLGRLDIVPRSLLLKEQQVHLERVAVDRLVMGMIGTPANDTISPDTSSATAPPWLGNNDGFRYFTRDWRFNLDALKITNSEIAMHTDSLAAAEGPIDPDHLVLRDIQVDLADVEVNNGRIALHLSHFGAVAGDAGELRLALEVNATPDTLDVQRALAALGENQLQLALRAIPGGLDALHEHPERVPMRLELQSTVQLASLTAQLKGVGFNLPGGASVEERWTTELRMHGSMSMLDTIRLAINGDQGSSAKLHGMIHDPQHWPRSRFRIELEEITMGTGIRQLVQAAAPEAHVPARMHIQGNATGNNGNVEGRLAMDSDVGRLQVSGSASGIAQKTPSSILLDLNVDDLQLDRLLNDTSFERTSLALHVQGSQLNSRNRRGSMLLEPRVLMVNGIDLSSLHLRGELQGDTMEMHMELAHEHAGLALRMNGAWPDEQDSIRVNLDLLVDQLHLRELGLLDHDLGIEGHWRGAGTLHTRGMGSFALHGEGLRIFNAQRDFVFEEFVVSGHLGADSTAFDLTSDAITLMYHTNIHPDSLITGSRERLMSILKDDSSFVATPGKRIEFAVTLPRTEWLTEIVVPELEAIELDYFTGTYDSDTDELQVGLHLPQLVYGTIELDELRVDLNARDNALNGTLSVERIDSDSLRIERLSITSTTSGGALTTILRMRDIEDDRYRIGTVLRTIDDVRELRVSEDLVLNSIPWTIHGDNVIRFTDDGPLVDHFVMSAGAQQVAISTPPQRLHIDFSGFQLTTLTDLVSTLDSIPLADGVLEGRVTLPRTEQALLNVELDIADLHVLGTEIGSLALRAQERTPDRYHATAKLEHTGNRFDAIAAVDLSGEKPAVDATAELAFQDLSFLKPFVREQVFALHGGLTGALKVQQRGDDLRMNGNLNFQEAAVGLVLTGATYRLPDERISFTNEGITFTAFNLVDSAGNRFQLDGMVDQRVENGPGLDLRLRTDRFQFVNSTYEDNQNFFGDLYTSLDLRIGGTVNNLVVNGDLAILEGTYMSVVLPASSVEMVSHEGIVVFTDDLHQLDTLAIRSDGEILRDSLAAQLPPIVMDLNLRISKAATFAIVMDPVTGDAATVSAEADLNFRYGVDRDIHLSGPLTLAGGGYTLNFHGLVKKEFALVEGGTVIWNGDPTRGRLDLQARYISNTPPFALVANADAGLGDAERNRLQARLPFEVIIGVTGQIDQPQINFGLDLPRMIRNSYPQVDARLQELAQPAQKEELNRQVFALLVLNSFIMDDPGSSPGAEDLARSAARNSVNQILSDQLNKLTGKYLGGVDISLGVNTYDQVQGNEAYQRTTVDYQVSKRVLDDRLTFEVGGSIGVDEQDVEVSNVSSTRRMQYAIMYDLTPEGKYRLRGFHENAFDLYDGEITRSGIAILYTLEFEENGRDRRQRREQLMQLRIPAPTLPPADEWGNGAQPGAATPQDEP